ncbi:MAG: GGDEF domain-containing protein [Rhodopseudomonas sp.]|uniref:GGDEF domain-containing protein n=1 Tax=Rhodopseudomonas sp. TaxID=1078 RepID=UPI00182366F3|nr:GGDEF domain-containing protein [Rhodopseudomonas sp.]NVN86596.1 GGDEF domain-containing protein [Rhodopseudomonas sp.]
MIAHFASNSPLRRSDDVVPGGLFARFIAWLTSGHRPQPAPVVERLLLQSQAKLPTLVLAIAGTTVTVIAAAYFTGALWASVWLGVDLSLNFARLIAVGSLQRATASGRKGNTTAPIVLALTWSVTFAIGCAMCVRSGDPVLTMLAGIVVAGLTGGISSRNAGTPRFGIAQVCILILPTALASIASPIPHIIVVAVVCPIYAIGLAVILLENYQLLLDLVLSENANHRLASYDALTGLPNRTMKVKRLAELLDGTVSSSGGRHPFTVFWLDLDGFKTINDRFGHAAGDRVLVAVAERLRDVVRADDAIFRVGGDEFVVLLPTVVAAEADAFASRIIRRISEPFDPGVDSPLRIGVSIGSACFPRDGDTADALLLAADTAMYEAKRRGKGFHVVHRSETPSIAPAADADARTQRGTRRIRPNTPGLPGNPVGDAFPAAIRRDPLPFRPDSV